MEQGVSPNDENEFSGGNSPLYWAALAGHAAVVEALCSGGADPGWKDPISGMTPLHRAAAMGHAEAVRALVCSGAPIDARDNTPTPCTPLQNAATRGRSDVKEALLELGAEAAAINLGDLAFRGDVAGVIKRLAQGFDSNDLKEFKDGEPPLYW